MPSGGPPSLTIPLDGAEAALDAFAEDRVAEATHPLEAQARQRS
jgi:hypothetical protein